MQISGKRSIAIEREQPARERTGRRWSFSFFLTHLLLLSVLVVSGSTSSQTRFLPHPRLLHQQAQPAEASMAETRPPGQVLPLSLSHLCNRPLSRAALPSSSALLQAIVYDVTHRCYLTLHVPGPFITASSMKVPILLTFLDLIERQGREPTSGEMDLMRTMIENSNNDSASVLYYNKIGGAAGVAQFMQRIELTGLSPNPAAWGWSLITPLSMVQLLKRLYEGSILTAEHRKLALDLMEHVEADQQRGVGDTAPAGAVVAMKDGWVTAPDGLWAVNSSGIVMTNQQVYILAVYTQEEPSLTAAEALIQQVCRTVVSQLSPHQQLTKQKETFP